MNKVDRERADVLRAELAQLCWLTLHDGARGGDGESLLKERLAAAWACGRRARPKKTDPSVIDASDRADPGRR